MPHQCVRCNTFYDDGANELLKGLKKEGDISEDDAFKAQESVQKITNEYISRIDEVTGEKEKEILEF